MNKSVLSCVRVDVPTWKLKIIILKKNFICWCRLIKFLVDKYIVNVLVITKLYKVQMQVLYMFAFAPNIKVLKSGSKMTEIGKFSNSPIITLKKFLYRIVVFYLLIILLSPPLLSKFKYRVTHDHQSKV